jgi:EAL domain-containing protein (putative c-di-GMP-specific phosphodiesterase class I)
MTRRWSRRGTPRPGRGLQRHPWAGCRRAGDVRRRFDDGSLSFVFQPIIDLRDGTTVGVEGLTRVASGERVEDLFSAASAQGRLLEVELHAIAALVRAAAALPAELYLAVNASPSTITSSAFADVVRGFPLDRLVVEVTEREPIPDYRKLRRSVASLRCAGLRLAVDDAGAGVASLHHLIELRPDIIKLDGTLTDAIGRDAGQRAMTRALAAFASEIGAAVVAECVESHASALELAALGVDHGQGFALGRPAPAGWPG